MQTEANQQLYISSSLTTRARAEAWRRERLLAGAPAPKPLPCPANAQILLAIAGWILFGALRPEPTHSMSMEPAPTAAHSRLDWYYSDSPTD
jgi:hypothetical protein